MGVCYQEQYVFVYDALLEALAVGDTALSCSLYMHRYTELKLQNPTTGKSYLCEEFEVLCFYCTRVICCRLRVLASFSTVSCVANTRILYIITQQPHVTSTMLV